VAPARRSMRRPSQLRLGVAGVWRVPVRTLLGAAVFAVATGAVTLLGSIATVFHGQVSGTLLGDAVTVQVRTADVVAAFAMVVLSVVTVADILYLNVRDRMAELAVLSATGWTDAAIGRLIAVEAAVIGLIGSVCGVSTAAVATLALVGGQSLIGVLAVSVLLIATGPMLASIAAVVPIRLLRGRAIAPLLAGE
ncbi:MAG: FtsX-like permease family protein, partial [Micromonosporaceae bacterium]